MNLNIDLVEKGEAWLLITVSDWFSAKDGQTYKAVWGRCKLHLAKTLGVKNLGGNHADWFMQVGCGEDTVFITGCRINYAQVCTERPQGQGVLCIES